MAIYLPTAAPSMPEPNTSTFPLSPLLLLTPDKSDDPFFNGSYHNWTNPGGGGVGGFQLTIAGVLIPLIYVAVCVIGLVGNTLVIYIVLHYVRTESVTNIYILNLAIADELFMLGQCFFLSGFIVFFKVLFFPTLLLALLNQPYFASSHSVSLEITLNMTAAVSLLFDYFTVFLSFDYVTVFLSFDNCTVKCVAVLNALQMQCNCAV